MALTNITVENTSIIEIKETITAIESVEIKTNANNLYFTPVDVYEVFGNTIVLKREYPVIKVSYRFTTVSDIEQRVSKNKINKQLKSLTSNNDVYSLTKKTNEYREKYAATHGCIYTDIDKTRSGFKSLCAPIAENLRVSGDNIPTIITSAAVNAVNTSTEKASADLITGKSTADGTPYAIISAANPKGLSEVYQGTSAAIVATPSQVKTTVKGVSAVNNIITEKNVLDNINSEAGNQLLLSMGYFLANAGKNQEQIAPETSYANVMPSIVEKSNGGSSSGNFATFLSGAHSTLPNLIEPSAKNFSTNINKNTITDGIIPVVINQSTNTQQLGGNITTFGKDTHVFTTVDTIQELEKEIGNVKRDVTTAVIHWSKTWSNQFLTAPDIDEIHKAQQQKVLGTSGYSVALNKNKAGIMWHYVILKDGTLQRGRPIELSTVDEMPFAERTIHIGFIAGYDVQFRDRSDGSAQATPNSITTQQWKTFNDICETLLNIKPGIGILGHNDIHNASTCPGFDVEAYVSEKFGYTSPYVPADFESANALTIEEMVMRVPPSVAKSSEAFENVNINMEFLSNENTNKDLTTGETKALTVTQIAEALLDFELERGKIDNFNIQFGPEEQNAVLKNNYYEIKRTTANDALYNLRDDRRPTAEQANEYRKILVNSGYVFDTRSKTWQKR